MPSIDERTLGIDMTARRGTIAPLRRLDDLGARVIGTCLLLLGLILNPVVLGSLSPDGRISSTALVWSLVAGEALLIAAGAWFLRRRPAGSANLALGLVVTGATLALAEAIVLVTGALVPADFRARQRAFFGLYEPDSALGFRVRSWLADFEMRWHDDHLAIRYDTDERGFRNVGRDYRAARVWFVGDSFTFGDWVTRERTFYGLLEAHLGEPVISLGTPGYDVTQYAASLERHLPGHRPDVIVVCIFANDLKRQPTPESLRSYYETHGWDAYREVPWRDKLVTGRLVQKAADALLPEAPRPTARPRPLERIVASNGLSLYREHGPRANYFTDSLHVPTEAQILRIIDRARRDSLPVIVVLFPSKESTHHQDFTDWLGPDALAVEEEGFRRICRLAESQQVPCHDLTRAFRAEASGATLYFATDSHWNERGHALAEREIRPHVSALLAARP